MKIAVVIPTYNRARLLVEAVESVLAQTHPATEIIVVDDGSTDDTAEAMQPYLSRGVRYVYQENAYLGAARNTGQNQISSAIDAVLFLDSDDRLLPTALARLSHALAGEPAAALAYGRPQFIGPNGQTLPDRWGVKDFTGRDVWSHLIQRNFLCTAGCVLLRREALLGTEPWDGALRGVEDWDMWLRLAELGAAFVRVADSASPVLEYRVHGESMSHDHAMMRRMEEALLAKHATRATTTPRRRQIENLLRQRQERRAAAEAAGLPPDHTAMASGRHQTLRSLMARWGLAHWYRRLPLPIRSRLRLLFGVGWDA